MEQCGRLLLVAFAAVVWIGLPLIVVNIRAGEDACVSLATVNDGESLHDSPAFFDLMTFVTAPLQAALESSMPFYIFFTFVVMAWVAATNVYVLWRILAWHQPCAFLAKAFGALMLCDLLTNLIVWMPPPSGFLQPGTLYYYVPAGLTVACTSQLFSGRLAWVVLATLDVCNAHQTNRAIQTAAGLLVFLGFVYSSACRHLYGMGTVATACAAVLTSIRYYKHQWRPRHRSSQASEEDDSSSQLVAAKVVQPTGTSTNVDDGSAFL